jgi:hypothetical protein
MLLAATETFAWRRQDKENAVETVKTMPSPLPVEENKEEPTEEVAAEPEPEKSISDVNPDAEPAVVGEENITDGEPVGEHHVDDKEDVNKPLERTLHVEHIILPDPDMDAIKPIEDIIQTPVHIEDEYVPNPEIEEEEVKEIIDDPDSPIIVPEQFNNKDVKHYKEDDLLDEDNPEKRAKRIWKRLNTDDTLKNQEAMESAGVIDEVPWKQYIKASEEDLEQFTKSNFGTEFPELPIKGDTYVRVDSLPSKLYRWNNTKWIEINKDTTDVFSYNDEYISYLIEKLGSGEYDPELLNDAERAQIEQQLKSQDL